MRSHAGPRDGEQRGHVSAGPKVKPVALWREDTPAGLAVPASSPPPSPFPHPCPPAPPAECPVRSLGDPQLLPDLGHWPMWLGGRVQGPHWTPDSGPREGAVGGEEAQGPSGKLATPLFFLTIDFIFKHRIQWFFFSIFSDLCNYHNSAFSSAPKETLSPLAFPSCSSYPSPWQLTHFLPL